MADRGSGADFLIGFVVGGLAGAAAALLLAPQSGEDTRALIRERGIELQERSVEMTADARSRMQQAVAEGKTAGAQKKEELLTGLDIQDPPAQDSGQV